MSVAPLLPPPVDLVDDDIWSHGGHRAANGSIVAMRRTPIESANGECPCASLLLCTGLGSGSPQFLDAAYRKANPMTVSCSAVNGGSTCLLYAASPNVTTGPPMPLLPRFVY